jgi:hypothetical protein
MRRQLKVRLLMPKASVDPANVWFAGQRERLAAAEELALNLFGEPLLRQRRRIASVKRNLTLGREGLKSAAARPFKPARAKAMVTVQVNRCWVLTPERVKQASRNTEKVKPRRARRSEKSLVLTSPCAPWLHLLRVTLA